MSKNIATKLFENMYPLVPKRQLLSYSGKLVNKRKLKGDEVLINYMIIPSNPAKRRRLMDKLIPKLLDGTATLNRGYLLTPKRKIIEATTPVLRHFKSRYLVENGVAKDVV